MKKVLAIFERMWYHIRAEKNSKKDPGVAKFGIALEWGSRGPEFESQHSDQKAQIFRYLSLFLYFTCPSSSVV